MNKLSRKERAQIIAALVEGNSIRATCRMTGAAKGTVLKLLADLGKACQKYQDEKLRNLSCKRVQCDEIWSFCYAKEKNLPEELKGKLGFGDVWTWTALCADTKLIVSFLVGERTTPYAVKFMEDLAGRISSRIQLTTDGHRCYLIAVADTFGRHIDYAMLDKIRYHTEEQGWSDIAQHLTIAPDGTLWTGRNWNAPPASAAGHNGNKSFGPFMIEMIGDFDAGQDRLEGDQREAVLRVVTCLLSRFDLSVGAVRFHNQMAHKSCPGSSMSYGPFLDEVRTCLTGLTQPPDHARRARASADRPFDPEALPMREALESLRTEAGADDSWDAEPSEEGDCHRYEAFVAASTDRAAGKEGGDGAGRCADEQPEGRVPSLTTQQ